MHFRRRGNNVQLVRSQTDPATGKKRPTPIGSLNMAKPEIPPAVRQACTPEEIAEIEAFLATARRIEAMKREHAALTLAEQIELAAGWLEAAEPQAARPIAAQAQAAWQQLRRVATRKGLL